MNLNEKHEKIFREHILKIKQFMKLKFKDERLFKQEIYENRLEEEKNFKETIMKRIRSQETLKTLSQIRKNELQKDFLKKDM